ncbi:PE family protein [Mycobacterium ulcerans str. Harvey]|uniref:PE family protein n=1 Tax=Mycobacterium ulcerans str. Harvey TaxID=1299332 RepID=A0ABP3A2F0_MYCUL|nr:PE family protein [Mycobacterium ulcerans str. Harvey]
MPPDGFPDGGGGQMSYVFATPELVAAAATDLAGVQGSGVVD